MYTAPEVGEIEVSVFGPGYGESILLHAGDNDWFLIDLMKKLLNAAFFNHQTFSSCFTD